MKITFNAITQPLFKPKKSATPLSSEEYMIYCARVSSPENQLNHETAPKLLKYLIDAGHWSPFEMISVAFEIETSRAIAQQLLRHRSFSFQDFSQRYAKVKNIEPIELRYQAKKNRQSSSNVLNDESLKTMTDNAIKYCQNIYKELINQGVAKECARMVLPLATQTTLIMHGTLRSWIHFLDQRCSDHAQKEIRLIAEEIKSQLSKVCPWTAKALKWNND